MHHYLRSIAILWIITAAAPIHAQEKFFDSNGVRIHYIEQGRGEPVVLVHGLGGSLQSWVDSGIVQNLAADHRVIALDARGHGKSGKPHDPRQYGREMPMDIARLLDHLGISKAHIVGYSMGASITSQLLTMHPERFLTATLGASAARFQWTEEEETSAQQEASEREKDCISRTLAYRTAPMNGPKPTDEELRTRSQACFADKNHDRFAIAALTRSRGETVISRDRLKSVTVPTLGVAGSLDHAILVLQDVKKVLPSMQLVTIDGATHGTAMRHPEFLAAVRTFIAAHRQTATR